MKIMNSWTTNVICRKRKERRNVFVKLTLLHYIMSLIHTL